MFRKGLFAAVLLMSILVIGCSRIAGSGNTLSPQTNVMSQAPSFSLVTGDADSGFQPAVEQAAGQVQADGQQSTPESAVLSVSFSGGVVDTGQDQCFDDSGEISCPQEGEAFYGQDAQYASLQPDYVANGDGTVTDLSTGLVWLQSPLEDKLTYTDALGGADTFEFAGYNDWRLPTIKELYSLIDFSGSTGMSAETSSPYIDIGYFAFEYGDTDSGERFIDAQYWSSTEYVGTVFGGQAAVFGVNFADGRIKGYPRDTGPGASPMTQYVRYVRGNLDYGENDFIDNSDGTISDLSTGLMWQGNDDGMTRDWEGALAYCTDLSLAGYDDWRLPNAKELQGIVDYSRAPDADNPTQKGPAIDPIFDTTENEPWFWTSTTHEDGPTDSFAVYVAFGKAFGVFSDPAGNEKLVNVHGAGAQRSSPKSGDSADWSGGHGPQSDEIRITNYARCVRDGAQSIDVATSNAVGAESGSDASSAVGNQPPGEGSMQGNQPPGDGQPPAGGQSPGNGQLPGGTGSGLGGSPPQEAIEACSQLVEGTSCSINTPQATLSGVCSVIQTVLACVPEGGPPGGAPGTGPGVSP